MSPLISCFFEATRRVRDMADPRAPRPNNLPREATTFVGREHEIADVKKLLSATRLLTLTGEGGIGKTRLALKIAADVLDRFSDGAWVAEFASLSDRSLVIKTITSVLRVSEQPGRPVLKTLTDYLSSATLLLLFDNCEHLLPECAHLARELLRGCPKLQILATSREAFGIAGELTYRVPSLSLPDLHNAPSAQTVT